MVVIGGLGFPVIIELLRDSTMRKAWTVHVRLTVYGTLLLLVWLVLRVISKIRAPWPDMRQGMVLGAVGFGLLQMRASSSVPAKNPAAEPIELSVVPSAPAFAPAACSSRSASGRSTSC